MFTEPLASWRKVSVRERKTSVDWAHEVKHPPDEECPKARKVILVCDNLNTNKPASLYETFGPEEARRLLHRPEIHYTRKHASWLNIAECELSVFTKQCPDRRIADIGMLRQHATAWYLQRNARQKIRPPAIHHTRRPHKTQTTIP